jgi:subtilisin family serine protease
VAGTIAASSNNRIGATGTCMNCSLIVAKVLGRVTEHGVPVLSTDAELVAGIAEVIYRGAQIVNLSLTIDSRGPDYCLLNQFDPVCVVLSMAQARDVVVVAASGNRNTSGTGRGAVAFPANDPRVVAVGGVQIDQAGKVSIWDERLPPIGYQHRAAGNTLIGSGFGPELEVVAPARDVLSTFYTRLDWFPAGRCGDSTLFVDPEGHQATSSAGEGYGTCTGTSMAAPHVSGLLALLNFKWVEGQRAD